jgi:hypothetical protein
MSSGKKAVPKPSIVFTHHDLLIMQQILKTCITPPNLQNSTIDLYDKITDYLTQ